MVPLTGEPLALDLLNTRANKPDGEIDLLDHPDTFQQWLSAQAALGRLTPTETPDLAAVRALRAHIETAVEHVRHAKAPPQSAVRVLEEAQRAAPPYRTLVWDGGTLTAVVRRAGDGRAQLLAELAEAAVDLLADPAIAKVRGCEGPNCRLLFLPAHPRRRWCSPALCGNRVRVARHYQRHKDD